MSKLTLSSKFSHLWLTEVVVCTTLDRYIIKQIIFSIKFNKTQFIMHEVCVQLIHLWQLLWLLTISDSITIIISQQQRDWFFCFGFFLCCNGILVDCDSSYSSICNIPMCHSKEKNKQWALLLVEIEFNFLKNFHTFIYSAYNKLNGEVMILRL